MLTHMIPDQSRKFRTSTAGKDAASRKLTYPELFGLEESKRLLARSRDEALALAAELPAGGGLFPALIDYLATRDR